MGNNRKIEIDLPTIMEGVNHYYANGQNQHLRLGQSLMNELVPSEKNPDIFYEQDDSKAFAKFIDEYGRV